MTKELRAPDVLNLIYTSIIGVMLTGNVFFVKRLVDQLDSLREIVWQLRQDVVVLQAIGGTKNGRRN